MGVLERVYKDFERSALRKEGQIEYEDIVKFVRDLQDNEFDAHLLIVGQNGLGKSRLMLSLMKALAPDSITDDNLLFAFHDTRDLIKKIGTLSRTVLGIDEAKKFFHYKMSMTTEQNLLVNYIEYARENGLAFIVCAKDYQHLNNNYREGKVQMVIWLIDRFEDGKYAGLGAVFLGNPIIDSGDKFMFSFLRPALNFEDFRIRAEMLPTFMGYLFISPDTQLVTKGEITLYKKLKRDGIEHMLNESIRKIDKKYDRLEAENDEKTEQGMDGDGAKARTLLEMSKVRGYRKRRGYED